MSLGVTPPVEPARSLLPACAVVAVVEVVLVGGGESARAGGCDGCAEAEVGGEGEKSSDGGGGLIIICACVSGEERSDTDGR